MTKSTSLISGPALIVEGFKLLAHKEIRWIVIVPVVLNLLMFVGATLAAIDWAGQWFAWLIAQVPPWLDWLMWLLWLLFAGLMLVIYAYTFTLVANLVGSPFYGVIAEKVMLLERGTILETPLSVKALLDIAWRSFRRELTKLGYFLPRTVVVALIALALNFIPLLNIFSPVVAGLWAAWTLSLQYLDYAADVDQIDFTSLRQRAAQNRAPCFSFGFSALGAAAIPLLNMLLLPACVVAGSLLWCRRFRNGLAAATVSQAT